MYAARDRIDEVTDRQRLVRDARYAYLRSWHPELAGGHRLAFRDNLESVRALRALYESGRLDANQRSWFEPVGEERLFDTSMDPEALRDLSQDPAHADVLARMRRALETWLAQTGDGSEEPEARMASRFRPGGAQPATPAPALRFDAGRVALSCSQAGASLGYRIDGGRWLLYTRPFEAPSGARVEAKAVRYGWTESEVVADIAP